VTASKALLSLVIPTYNEESRLPATLETLAAWIPASCFDVEVIIVDDGSMDRTKEVAQSFLPRIPQLRFHQIPHVGYMNAIITGLQLSTRPLRATLEADCPVHPRMLEGFVRDFPDYDIVMGSRALRSETAEVSGKSRFRRFLSSILTRAFVLLFKGGIHDPQIGFKLYKAPVVEKVLPMLALPHDGLKSAEIIVKAMALGYRVKEVPVTYKHDPDSRCVPVRGRSRVIVNAALALLELWAQSYVEFRRGRLPVCPVRFGFLLAPVWPALRVAAPGAAPSATPPPAAARAVTP
jgi:glycosyltransferase involved in cell wall biosynthesis